MVARQRRRCDKIGWGRLLFAAIAKVALKIINLLVNKISLNNEFTSFHSKASWFRYLIYRLVMPGVLFGSQRQNFNYSRLHNLLDIKPQ